jgi:hypothetical protein
MIATPPSIGVGFECGRSMDGRTTTPARAATIFAKGIIAKAKIKAKIGTSTISEPVNTLRQYRSFSIAPSKRR